jgi:hypothetical protein
MAVSLPGSLIGQLTPQILFLLSGMPARAMVRGLCVLFLSPAMVCRFSNKIRDKNSSQARMPHLHDCCDEFVSSSAKACYFSLAS